jgi:hypothetical protein
VKGRCDKFFEAADPDERAAGDGGPEHARKPEPVAWRPEAKTLVVYGSWRTQSPATGSSGELTPNPGSTVGHTGTACTAAKRSRETGGRPADRRWAAPSSLRLRPTARPLRPLPRLRTDWAGILTHQAGIVRLKETVACPVVGVFEPNTPGNCCTVTDSLSSPCQAPSKA